MHIYVNQAFGIKKDINKFCKLFFLILKINLFFIILIKGTNISIIGRLSLQKI